MNLFEGLANFEIVLFVFGSLLILILLIALIIMMIQGRRIRKLIPFFFIGIIMIAYPSIKVIEFGNIKIKLKISTEKYLRDPDGAEALTNLQHNLSRIEQFPNLSAETIYDLALAKLVLGDTDAAYALSDSAKKMQPSLENAGWVPAIYLAMPEAVDEVEEAAAEPE